MLHNDALSDRLSGGEVPGQATSPTYLPSSDSGSNGWNHSAHASISSPSTTRVCVIPSHQVYTTRSTTAWPPLPLPPDIQGERLRAFAAAHCTTGYVNWRLPADYDHHAQAYNMMTLERMYGRTGSDSLASETQGDLSLHDERCSTTPQIASRPASLIPGIRLPQRRGAMQLWEFLLELLDKEGNSHVIQWVNKEALTFQVMDPDLLASGWGEVKARPNMNYDKLCRSLRYYYQKKFLTKVHSEQFVYKFLCPPSILRKALSGRTRYPGRELTHPYFKPGSPGGVKSRESHREDSESASEQPSEHQQIQIKTEPVDDYDSMTTAEVHDQRQYYQQCQEDEDNNYCQSSTSQRMVVVKDERDPEVHNKDSVLPEKIKYPHGPMVIHLWEFLLDLINSARNNAVACWTNIELSEFKINNPEELARQWGIICGHTGTTSEQILKALDYYCQTKLLLQTEKHTFRFICIPSPHYHNYDDGNNTEFHYSGDSVSSRCTTPDTEDKKPDSLPQSHTCNDQDTLNSEPHNVLQNIKKEKGLGSLTHSGCMPDFPLASQISTSDLIDMEILVAEQANYDTVKVKDMWDPTRCSQKSIVVGQGQCGFQ